jgi:hypothetical protein
VFKIIGSSQEQHSRPLHCWERFNAALCQRMDASNTGTTTPHLTALHRRQNEVLFAHKNFTFSPCQYVLLAAPSLKKTCFLTWLQILDQEVWL